MAQYYCPGTTAFFNLDSRTAYELCFPILLAILGVMLREHRRFYLITSGIAAAVSACILIYRHRRLAKLRAKKQTNNEYFDEFETAARVLPWSKAQYPQITLPKRLDRARLRIVPVNGDLGFFKPYVDANVICSREQMAALRQQVEQWQAQQAGLVQTASMKI